MFLREYGDFAATVSVENAEELLVVIKMQIRDVCVFLNVKVSFKWELTMLRRQPCISAATNLVFPCLPWANSISVLGVSSIIKPAPIF